MIRFIRSLTLLVLGILALAGCGEDGRYGMTVINQGEHIIESGQRMTSDVAIVGGTIELEEGASVTGTIYMFGGNSSLRGDLNGDLVALGGSVMLEDEASISGDFYVAGAQVSRAAGATIGGEETALTGQELGIGGRPSFAQFLWQVTSTALILAFLAAITVRLMPALTHRVAETGLGFPIISGSLGILVLLVLPILLVFMAFTIILLPLTILGLLVLALVIGYGLIGIGRGVGERVARWRGWHLSPSVAAAAGTGSLIVVLNFLGMIPIVAEISLALTGAVAIGSVILSGFGVRVYEPPTYENVTANSIAQSAQQTDV